MSLEEFLRNPNMSLWVLLATDAVHGHQWYWGGEGLVGPRMRVIAPRGNVCQSQSKGKGTQHERDVSEFPVETPRCVWGPQTTWEDREGCQGLCVLLLSLFCAFIHPVVRLSVVPSLQHHSSDMGIHTLTPCYSQTEGPVVAHERQRSRGPGPSFFSKDYGGPPQTTSPHCLLLPSLNWPCAYRCLYSVLPQTSVPMGQRIFWNKKDGGITSPHLMQDYSSSS